MELRPTLVALQGMGLRRTLVLAGKAQVADKFDYKQHYFRIVLMNNTLFLSTCSLSSKSYIFRLMDGSLWRFTSTVDAFDCLSKLSNILQIFTDDETQKSVNEIRFTAAKTNWKPFGSDYAKVDFPFETGLATVYTYQIFPFVRIWKPKTAQPILCEIINRVEEKWVVEGLRYALYPIRSQVFARGGLPLHAALLEYKGGGYIIAAHSGSGKSTCSRRVPPHWKALCDDEVLIARDSFGKYHCHPFPTWSDFLENRVENTWDSQNSVPLRAIFNLEKANVDQIFPIGGGKSAALMFESTAQICMRFWMHIKSEEARTENQMAFENACDIAQKIPAFNLRATLHGRFWEQMECVIDEL